MNQEFNSLNIIEIASVLAGPSVGLFFAELGATVTKIENKAAGGDVTRSWKLPSEDQHATISAYYSSVNQHKTSLFLDLTNQRDQTKLINRISAADIVIVNFKKGDAEKFGLDYAALKKRNTALIYGEITGFGANSDRVAYDLILQAETGFMSMNGTPESGPVKMPIALIDILAGHQLKSGILLALYQRDFLKMGGCKVSVSLYDAALASLANQATNWLMAQHIPGRIGSTHPNIAPYGDLFTTKDEVLITFAVGSDKQFHKLCLVLGATALADDPCFTTNSVRVENRVKLQNLLAEVIGKMDAEPLLEELSQHFVPAARIKNMKEVFENPAAQALVEESIIENQPTKSVKTVVFHIER